MKTLLHCFLLLFFTSAVLAAPQSVDQAVSQKRANTPGVGTQDPPISTLSRGIVNRRNELILDPDSADLAKQPASMGDLAAVIPDSSALIYVSKDSNATDTRTGLSDYDPAAPFATISAAISAASAGDTVIVLPGTYAESVTAANGVDLYGLPGATISSSAGTALSVPTGVSCVVDGAFDFIAGTSSTSPVVSLTGTGEVMFSANSVLHQATEIATNETGIYTTKATARISVVKESRSVAYDGIWVDGGTNVYIRTPLSIGGDNGVEVTGGVNVLLDIKTITGEAGNGLNLVDGGGGNITSLVLRVVDSHISSTQNRAVGVSPSSDDYLSITLQGCIIANSFENINPAVHVVHGGGVTGRIIIRDTHIRDDSGGFATYSIDSNAPIEMDGVAVDLPLEGTVIYSGSYTSPDGNLVAKGTTTNDSAAAGDIGEVISSTIASGSAVSLTTGTAANVTSISLTAGDWDISGSAYFLQGATTTATYYTAGIGATSATLPGYAGAQESIPGTAGAITGYDPSVGIPPTIVSLTSTTTYYLVAQSAFLVDTNAVYGHLRARRMR